jgi:hypothetical protein
MMVPRKSVLEFAEAMEEVLAKNDFKGGWDKCSDSYLARKLSEEFAELQQTFDFPTKFTKYTPDEAIDLANICMMIWENTKKRLDAKVGETK